MTGDFEHADSASLKTNLAGLAAASLACVAILLVAIVGHGPETGANSGIGVRELVIVAVLGGAIVFVAAAVAMLLRALQAARRFEQQAAEEANQLRQDIASTEAIIESEPVAVLAWDHRGGARLLAHYLPGAPEDIGTILSFRNWLDEPSARDLKHHLDSMFRQGETSTLAVRTLQGRSLEAQCRVHRGRAFLRLRDLGGERLKLAQLKHKHDALALEADSTKSLFDLLPMVIWDVNRDGQIRWANRAYVHAVDAETLEQVVSGQIQLLEGRDRTALQAHLEKGEGYRERVHIIVGGERRAFDLVAVPMGERVTLFATDADALEVAEGELSRRSAEYDRTLDRVSTAIALFDSEQRLAFHNEAFTQLWQLESDWLDRDRRDGEILDFLREAGALPESGDYRKWKAKRLDVYRTRDEAEDWWHLPDGRTIHVRTEPRPDGGLAYLYDDATERLALERDYNEMLGVQRETLNTLAQGIAVFAPDGRLRLSNPAFARIWRLEPEGLTKRPHVETIIAQCNLLHEDPGVWGALYGAVATITDVREAIEGQMLRPDGSTIAYACLPLPDGATLITFLDISDRRRVEQALIERADALEAADRLKNDFVSHVSYELRTPLTTIIGFSEMLEDSNTGPLNTRQREYLATVNESSKTLKAIVDDILDLATMNAGALALNLDEAYIADIIEGAVLGVRDRLRRADIQLKIAVEPGVHSLVADENRIKQVVYNLLTNAIGFSRANGTIHLNCRRDNDMIVFSVEDQGIGIPNDMQEQVFERFETNPRGTTHRGAGLGLAICKRLVDLHGGSIALTSQPDVGSIFTVRLPEAGHGLESGAHMPSLEIAPGSEAGAEAGSEDDARAA